MPESTKVTVEMKAEVNLEALTFPALVRVPKRVWSVHHPATGETCECRSIRRLLWVEFAPRWVMRIEWFIEDFKTWLRCGFYCDDCGWEGRSPRHRCP